MHHNKKVVHCFGISYLVFNPSHHPIQQIATTNTNSQIGTAIITQVGLILLVAHIWASILLSPLILFSAHPLLNSAALLVLTQGILILQPTHTATQKRQGTIAHAGINALSSSLLIAGLVVIEVNKFAHNGTHFESAHAIRMYF